MLTPIGNARVSPVSLGDLDSDLGEPTQPEAPLGSPTTPLSAPVSTPPAVTAESLAPAKSTPPVAKSTPPAAKSTPPAATTTPSSASAAKSDLLAPVEEAPSSVPPPSRVTSLGFDVSPPSQAIDESDRPSLVTRRSLHEEPNRRLLWLAAAIALLCALGALGWRFLR